MVCTRVSQAHPDSLFRYNLDVAQGVGSWYKSKPRCYNTFRGLPVFWLCGASAVSDTSQVSDTIQVFFSGSLDQGQCPDVDRTRRCVSPGHAHSFTTTKRNVAFFCRYARGAARLVELPLFQLSLMREQVVR